MTPTPKPRIVISGTGLWTPPYTVTNEELVESYNAFADKYNEENKALIDAGEIEPKPHSSAEFIEKASGIKARYAYCKEGILDIDRMRPKFPERSEDEVSNQAEIAIYAAKKAMAAAGKTGADVDVVIVSCAYTQRSYPAIAIEVQKELGIEGFGFDMLVACSAATFGLHRAYEMVASGTAKCVLSINPELVTTQVNFCDRDSHFIFGDVSVATIVETEETCTSEDSFEVLGIKAQTRFSSNIRSNFGHINFANDTDPFGWDKLFHQNGRKVFKEVCPMAADHIIDHLSSLNMKPDEVRRWWLHQANLNMNNLVIKRLLHRGATEEEAPTILDRYANTASAGSLIVFHLYRQDFSSGDLGVICSFGAGYSLGSLIVRKQ
ncbi:MAG: beta-ketoacyl-ACP synthase III [Proteobacteria bacterium]|nr:beta-ketoacyl-ACP synthase III [Pseudomonadota bacterium]